MKLSKYFQHIKMDNQYVAIFNSILMQIIFVEKEKINDIKNFNLSKEETKLMIENGIYETTGTTSLGYWLYGVATDQSLVMKQKVDGYQKKYFLLKSFFHLFISK